VIGSPAGGKRVFDKDLAKRGYRTAFLSGDFAEFERETGREINMDRFSGDGAAGTTSRACHFVHSPFCEFFGRFSLLPLL